MKTLLIQTFILLLSTFSVMAQNDCGEEVAMVFRDAYHLSESTKTSEIQKVYFTSSEQQLDEYADKVEKGDAIDGVFKAVGITWSKNRKRESYRNNWRSKKQEYESYSDVRGDFWRESIIKTVDAKQAKEAYIKCLEFQSGSKTANAGVYFELLGSEKDSYRTLRLSKVARPQTSSEIKVNRVSTQNVRFLNDDNQIVDGLTLRDWNAVTENVTLQDPENKGTIDIDLEGVPGFTIVIPARKKNSNIPVGTIIASVLEYPQFCSSIGEQAPSNSDYKNVSFAPCDGRGVIDSELSKLGKSYTPDLRGQFLRGLHQMYSPSEPSTYSNGSDPDYTDRTVVNGYSYQKDNLGSHSHEYSDRGVWRVSGSSIGYYDGGSTSEEPKTSGTTGGNESRSKNMAVYYYIKIN